MSSTWNSSVCGNHYQYIMSIWRTLFGITSGFSVCYLLQSYSWGFTKVCVWKMEATLTILMNFHAINSAISHYTQAVAYYHKVFNQQRHHFQLEFHNIELDNAVVIHCLKRWLIFYMDRQQELPCFQQLMKEALYLYEKTRRKYRSIFKGEKLTLL